LASGVICAQLASLRRPGYASVVVLGRTSPLRLINQLDAAELLKLLDVVIDVAHLSAQLVGYFLRTGNSTVEDRQMPEPAPAYGHS
jgi:hypothetical protein